MALIHVYAYGIGRGSYISVWEQGNTRMDTKEYGLIRPNLFCDGSSMFCCTNTIQEHCISYPNKHTQNV